MARFGASTLRSINDWLRLASEGSRLPVPWSFELPTLIEDPTPAHTLLEKLKPDGALYVWKSVAIYLYDITKDNPEMMLDWVGQWNWSSTSCAWIVKHASQSLLIQGHPRAFSLLEFESEVDISINNLTLNKQNIQLGGSWIMIWFKFSKINGPKIAVGYRVLQVKKLGKQALKFFNLKELNL